MNSVFTLVNGLVSTVVVDVLVRTSDRRSTVKLCVIVTRHCTGVVDVLVRTIDRRSTVKPCVIVIRLHWGRGRPRPHIRPAKHGQAVCYCHSSPLGLWTSSSAHQTGEARSSRMLFSPVSGVEPSTAGADGDVHAPSLLERSTASIATLHWGCGCPRPHIY